MSDNEGLVNSDFKKDPRTYEQAPSLYSQNKCRNFFILLIALVILVLYDARDISKKYELDNITNHLTKTPNSIIDKGFDKYDNKEFDKTEEDYYNNENTIEIINTNENSGYLGNNEFKYIDNSVKKKIENNGDEEYIDNNEVFNFKEETLKANNEKANKSNKDYIDVNKWKGTIGKGLNLDILNQCLEKGSRYYGRQESWSKLENEFPGIPVMDKTYNHSSVGYVFYPHISSPWGSSTTRALSKSKHLTYTIIPKAGCSSLRFLVAQCDQYYGGDSIPCDIKNEYGRPWRPEDAVMNFNKNAGFYRNSFKKGTKNVIFGNDFSMQYPKTVSFTFVADPINRFISGFRQVKRYKGKVGNINDEIAYINKMKLLIDHMFDQNKVSKKVYDLHYAPQLFHLYNAAIESSQLSNKVFEPPFHYVGRMDRTNHTTSQKDWEGLIELMREKYPEAVKYVNESIAASNGKNDGVSKEEFKKLRHTAHQENLKTYLRLIKWERLAKVAHTALGPYAKSETMPDKLARKLCAIFYADYICFGINFPKQCVDPITNEYNVNEYKKRIIQ